MQHARACTFVSGRPIRQPQRQPWRPPHAQVFDLWVSYHNTADGAASVSLSLPHVLGIDARPWVLEEHSLVISAGAEVVAQVSLNTLVYCLPTASALDHTYMCNHSSCAT